MRITTVFAVATVIAAAVAAPILAREPDVLALVRRNYSGTQAVNATFDHSIYWSVREREEKRSGEMTIAPGDRFRVTIGRESFVSDGTTYWQYNERNSQVIVRNFSDIDPATLPSRLLTTVLMNRAFTEKSRSGGTVELVWDGNGQDIGGDGYTAITAVIDIQSGIIKTLRLVDKNENIHTYTFKRTTFDRLPRNENFRFTVPRGVEVLDMRGG